MKKLKKLGTVALIGACTFSVSACGSKGEKTKEIVVWNAGIQTSDTAGNVAKEDLPIYKEIKRFESENEGYKITLVDYGMEDLQKAFTSANMAEEGPDIVAIWAGSATLGYQDYLEDLTSYLTEDEKAIYDTSSLIHKNNNSEESMVGLPYGTYSTNVMYYNKKIFTEQGLTTPTTWEEFINVSEQLKKKGIIPLEVGDKDGYNSTWAVSNMVGNLLGPDNIRNLSKNQEKLSGDNFSTAVKTWGDYIKKGYTNVDYLTKSDGDAIQSFVQGEAAMLIHGNWSASEYEAMGDDVDMIKIPAISKDAQFKEYMISQPNINLIMPKYAKNKEVAAKFMKEICKPEFTVKSNEALYSKPVAKRLAEKADSFSADGKNITGFDSIISGEAANEFYKLVPTYIKGTLELTDFTTKLDALNK